MIRHLTFILGFLLAAGFASAGIVRYGIESNGTALPARPVTNFTGAMSCYDDADGGKTVCSAVAFWFDGGSGSMYTTATVNNPDGGTGIVFSTASGAYAAAMAANGARLDFGTGSIDYAASDGTGIETPSYWESTRGFAFGPGVIAPIIHPSGSTAPDFTNANQGYLAFNSTEQRMYVSTVTGWVPTGMPNVAMERQTYTTRVAGAELALYPQFAERVLLKASGKHTLDMYWFSGGQVPAKKDGSFYYPLVSDAVDGKLAAGYSVASDAPDAFQTFLNTDGLPSMCQRVYMSTDLADQRVEIGIAPASGTEPKPTDPGGYYFRYDTSLSDVNWKLVAYDNSGSYIVDTGVEVNYNKGGYVLCVYLDALRKPYAVINGSYRGASAIAVPANIKVGPAVMLTPLTDTSKTIYVGSMQVETN